MSYTTINRRQLTFQDVSTGTTNSDILALKKRYHSKSRWEIHRGAPYPKDGEECQRIYVTLDRPEDVDDFMANRSFQPWKVMRTLPKGLPLYDRPVTGLKIKIDSGHRSAGKLTENNLKKHFSDCGENFKCKWTNADHTEALFTFSYYDTVDKIILSNQSLEIKGVKIHLEKAWTANDYVSYQRLYVVHVTDLPPCITSEEVSRMFNVPITRIRLYPSFRLEEAHDVNGRKSSEAWITSFDEEDRARQFAERNTGKIMSQQRIFCEAMLDLVQTEELCEHFQKGHCPFMNKCHFKHFFCSNPDDCEEKSCWLGHTVERTTTSFDRPQFYSEEASYRLRLSNLPLHITHEILAKRLGLKPKLLPFLILQPEENNPGAPRMAYLIRQPFENRLRQYIDRWHDKPFSPTSPQKIQCQLEINQDFFQWNDLTDMIQSTNISRPTSPALSRRSFYSNVVQGTRARSPANSTISCKENVSKSPPTVEELRPSRPGFTTQLSSSKKNPNIDSLRGISGQGNRHQPPAELSNFSKRWHWTNQIIPKDASSNPDELYWIESESIKDKNLVTKIYLPKTDRKALVRAQRERLALERLKHLTFVPKYLNSNVDVTTDELSNNDLLTVMKRIDGEKLSNYVKSNKLELCDALKLVRQLLAIIKQIHDGNVIHRDIQPKNILVRRRPNTEEIDLTLINFSSAWVTDHPQTNSGINYDGQLGDIFYQMPQFDSRQDQENEQVKKAQRSPTIDASGIGTILFWLITGHEPKESRNISNEAPHQIHVHSKVIEKKIIDTTAFRTDAKIHEHLKRHLTLIFDRTFHNHDQQWSMAELDYQLQLIVELIANETNYFPAPSSTSDSTLLPSIPIDDPFYYGVSVICYLKKAFQSRYANCIRWSTEEKSSWCAQNGRIENYDLLIFLCQGKDFPINIKWEMLISKNQQLLVHVLVRTNSETIIRLPLGIWKINELTADFETHLKNFEMEIKILINILFKSVAQ